MSFSDDPNFTYDFLAQRFTGKNINREESPSEYDRHPGDQYRNHGQNLMLVTAIEVVEQQKQFSGAASEEFARAFKARTSKIVEALKAKEERRNNLPPQLPPPLQELKLRSFSHKNSDRRKMTGTEAAITAEADTARAQRKAEKELEIKRKYEAELAALREDSSTPPLPQSRSPTSDPLPPALSESQVHMTNIDSPIHISSSDSESSDDFSIRSLPAPRQSGRTKKPTRKLESQKRRDAEQAAQEPKPKKRKKSKMIVVTSQLKELLGSDIEF